MSAEIVSSSRQQPPGLTHDDLLIAPGYRTPDAVFRVRIPPQATPGAEFHVRVNGQIVRVFCPPDGRPGSWIQITVPQDNSDVRPVPNTNPPSYFVKIPNDVRPGQRFTVTIQGEPFQVVCPQHACPGMEVKITPPQSAASERAASPTEDNHGVRPVPNSNPPAYMVRIPPHVQPGASFSAVIQGERFQVTCPPDARPGMEVQIIPPPRPPPSPPARELSLQPSRPPPPISLGEEDDSTFDGSTSRSEGGPSSIVSEEHPSHNSRSEEPPPTSASDEATTQTGGTSSSSEETPLFEVHVPDNVRPGQSFAIMAGGVRVLVACPTDAGPGDRIRFRVPVALQQHHGKSDSRRKQIQIKYPDGWSRILRGKDHKFQWVCLKDSHTTSGSQEDRHKRFHVETSAYVRDLQIRSGEDRRFRTGRLRLVPAAEAVTDAQVKTCHNRVIVRPADIAQVQSASFSEKASWFQSICRKLCVSWEEGHILIHVRRSFLINDAFNSIMSLSRIDMRKAWRIAFIGEKGLDAGGLMRDFFQRSTEHLFDPDTGLWKSSETNPMCMEINPLAELVIENYLMFYRFTGRILGRALFDGQLVSGHLVPSLYKHILGWPLTFGDLEMVDNEYYANLKQTLKMYKNGDDISELCLDFTTSESLLGERKQVELIKNGSGTDVTNENLPEYLEANFKYRLMNRDRRQLSQLLLGIFDVIPEPLLTVFDYQELELLLCGLPFIDVRDWMENTIYVGEYRDLGASHPVCRWFWEVVKDEFDEEMKARLLNFVTGTSGVPPKGFSTLPGNDGNIQRFTIDSLDLGVMAYDYARAHTCFNRIDLPMYRSKEELREKLNDVVILGPLLGFGLE